MNLLPHKSAPPELKKYYFWIYGLSVVVAAIVLINIFGSISLRSDSSLESAVQAQHDAIDSYATKHRVLPAIGADAGIKDTKGVDYKKINSSRYILCATFRTKSDGYSPHRAVPTAIQNSGMSVDANTKFSDGDTNYLKHDKGYTCIYYTALGVTTYNPPIIRYNNARAECSPNPSVYPYRVKAIISSINTTSQTINLSGDSQSTYNGVTTYTASVALENLAYDDNTAFYDSACKKADASVLKANDTVYLYLESPKNGETVEQVEVRPAANSTTPVPPRCTGTTVCTQ